MMSIVKSTIQIDVKMVFTFCVGSINIKNVYYISLQIKWSVNCVELVNLNIQTFEWTDSLQSEFSNRDIFQVILYFDGPF